MNFLPLMLSPKNATPPVRMMTVLMCPTTLYVSELVAPITRNVLRFTNYPSTADIMMAVQAATE